jgi:uncharacterized protein (DUF1015 family)
MARLFPFRALRYAIDRVRLADVVTQPYDKITPEMRERYYAASPQNFVRIILGDPAVEGDVYAAAAKHGRQWREQGILQPDDAPSFYAYSQIFEAGGRKHERRGVIGTLQLEDYENKVVYRHELTLTGPKEDRLKLLRATATHWEQLFLVYRDPAKAVEALLFPARAADAEVTDEYGVLHRLWRVSDPTITARVQALFADKPLMIADGHHRYETALNYRNERRAQAGKADANAPYERVMVTLVNMDSPGLVILPTHRVVFNLVMFDPEQLLRGAKRYFDVGELPADVDAAQVTAALGGVKRGTAIVAFTGARNWLLRARPEAIVELLPDLPARQRALDVVVLHRGLLQQILGISEQAIREQRNLHYIRDAAEALARVRSGAAEAAFLMNPVPVAQMAEVALAGDVMPQKSTDFYPKMLSGLAVYALE